MSRTRKPDHGELFKLAMEDGEIRDRLAEANRPVLPNCLVCDAPSAGLATWSPPDLDVEGYDGPDNLAVPLCKHCKDRSDRDSQFMNVVLNKSLASWEDGSGLLVIVLRGRVHDRDNRT
jgi:hypothetical protein